MKEKTNDKSAKIKKDQRQSNKNSRRRDKKEKRK